MFARVIPALRLPRRLGIFDYSVPEGTQVKPGDLVTVRFRGKSVPGLVAEINSEPSVSGKAMQPIQGVLGIALPDDLISLVSWIVRTALVSPALALKTIVPAIPKRPRSASAPLLQSEHPTLRITQERAKQVGQRIRALLAEKRPYALIRYGDPAEKIVALLALARTFHENKQTLLILVPTHADLAAVLLALRTQFPGIAVLRSGMQPMVLWEEWNRCRSGEATIILGTRGAAFAPSPALHGIVLCDDEAAEYKAEDAPRLHARAVVEERGKQHGASVIMLSQAPRVETFASAAKYGPPTNLAAHERRAVEIVDLQNEVRERGSMFGDTVLEAMRDAVASDQAVIVFQNRRGAGGALQCHDCKFIFLCPECAVPWSVHEKALICHHCGRSSPAPLACASCGGTRLKSTGAGTQRIEAELHAQFADRKILRVDTDAPVASATALADADIIIGTRLLTGRYLGTMERLRKIGLIVIPLAENLFGRTDFRAAEYAYQWLVTIVHAGVRNRARTIIQTFRPEHTVLQSAAAGNDQFYEEELQSRKTFGYPPFSRLTLLSVREKQESAARETAEKTATALRSSLRDAEVIGPFAPMPKKRRGMFEWRLLVKSAPNLPPAEELQTLPEEWTIDVDPETV